MVSGWSYDVSGAAKWKVLAIYDQESITRSEHTWWYSLPASSVMNKACSRRLRACLPEGRGTQVGEVTRNLLYGHPTYHVNVIK